MRTLKEVFDAYSDPDSLDFSRSRATVRLFETGTAFVSRSEAKRLTEGLDRFEEVDVDFTGVDEVGQGFVDEVFRVWAQEHPDVRLNPIGMSPAVEAMIRRGFAFPGLTVAALVASTPVAPFRHRIRVRYNECDAQAAVFNANYLVYFDVAITEMWREAFGSYDDALARWGLDLVVAEANVRFLAPARFDDELDVDVTVEQLGTTSFTLRFDVRRGSDDIAQGRSRYVFIDLEDGNKHKIPNDVRTTLERYG